MHPSLSLEKLQKYLNNLSNIIVFFRLLMIDFWIETFIILHKQKFELV